MIRSVTISNVATFIPSPQKLDDLSQVNFIFGANGTGKTTISRVIGDVAKFPNCSIDWINATPMETLVYNREFVEQSFEQSENLKGVFTLGEENIETTQKIAAAKEKVDTISDRINELTETLQGQDGVSGKLGEMIALETRFTEQCWLQKQKHEEKLGLALKGTLGSKERFREKVLTERTQNAAQLWSRADLEGRARTLFESTPVVEESLPKIDVTNLLSHESDPILGKIIVGREDVDLASMIKALGNSDWVSQGRVFYEQNDQICPFCQQSTTASFAANLAAYFDETFISDVGKLKKLTEGYRESARILRSKLDQVLVNPSKFLTIETLRPKIELLASTLSINDQRLDSKTREPSQKISLSSISTIAQEIGEMFVNAQAQIDEHNEMVKNLANERKQLTELVWKYIVDGELVSTLAGYDSQKSDLSKAIESIRQKIETAKKEKDDCLAEIRDLEKTTTSVQPTVDGINSILRSFGFKSFQLGTADGENAYRILRSDGSDAKKTLSEGEKTFITFLYFYHLLRGSQTETGQTTNRVVVIDDPVSSLDSDVLFVVSSLIKKIFLSIREGVGNIRQIFVFTHNVYFHKDVTYNRFPNNIPNKLVTYWVVRKPGTYSAIERHAANPVRASYELLWMQLQRSDESSLTLQNTMRRILEHYFRILGGLDFEALSEKFDGEEKQICKSLFSWLHTGSHGSDEDLYMSIDQTDVNRYRDVFRNVFVQSDHAGHYQMMMEHTAVAVPESA